MIAISFLYIIHKDKYLKEYKTGFRKYLGSFLIPKLKPKIIDTIEIEDKIVGKIAGINLKDIDLQNKDDINEYLKSIKSIIDSDFNNLYIEGQEEMGEELIKYIGKELHLSIDTGYSNKIRYLPEMIVNIFKVLKEEPSQKELLIVGEDSKTIKQFAVNISNQFKFISIYGVDEDDDVYDFILENTGVSAFFPTDLNKVIKNYSVIINLSDYIFDSSYYEKTKRSTIVFDFGNTNKQFSTIQDFGYKIKNLKMKQTPYLSKVINSSLCESFKSEVEHDYIVPKSIISGGKAYGIEEYIKLFIKFKGKF